MRGKSIWTTTLAGTLCLGLYSAQGFTAEAPSSESAVATENTQRVDPCAIPKADRKKIGKEKEAIPAARKASSKKPSPN